MPAMTDYDQLKDDYHPPSVKRWGTVSDLTAGGVTGCSGDTFADDPHSVFSNGNGNPNCGSGGNGGGNGN
jgi:hypothetical protein